MFFKDRVFIIAEAGVNHNGDINLAYKLIDAAIDAGVDAIKFQTFKAEKLTSIYAEMAEYQKKNMKKNEEQLEMLRKLELSYDDFNKLKEYCDDKGIMFLSTPFEHESIDFLDQLIDIFKIPSGEITNFSYLSHVAQKNKPIIMSTGMCNLGEIEKALDVIFCTNKNSEVYLLHCTTNYPTPFEDVNLKSMLTIKEAFKLPVGYSDHTEGIEIPIAAVALGATIIEKHFTLDKNLPGPDHKASLEPDELKKMVTSIRNIEKALGNGIKKPTVQEEKIMKAARKSIVAAKDLKAGTIINYEDLEMKRPGNGLNPEFESIIIGKKILHDINKDQPLKWDDFLKKGDD